MKVRKPAELLARGTHCQVNHDEGVIHLSIGPCTMRLEPSVFYSIYERAARPPSCAACPGPVPYRALLPPFSLREGCDSRCHSVGDSGVPRIGGDAFILSF